MSEELSPANRWNMEMKEEGTRLVVTMLTLRSQGGETRDRIFYRGKKYKLKNSMVFEFCGEVGRGREVFIRELLIPNHNHRPIGISVDSGLSVCFVSPGELEDIEPPSLYGGISQELVEEFSQMCQNMQPTDSADKTSAVGKWILEDVKSREFSGFSSVTRLLATGARGRKISHGQKFYVTEDNIQLGISAGTEVVVKEIIRPSQTSDFIRIGLEESNETVYVNPQLLDEVPDHEVVG